MLRSFATEFICLLYISSFASVSFPDLLYFEFELTSFSLFFGQYELLQQ